jgi:GT2 family glycosyltransferase
LSGAGKPPIAITAVIVNHNGGEQILRCIAHLEAQQLRPETILVVDNCSTDGSREAAAKASPRVRVIALGENLGPSIARNRGIQAATGDLVLLVDDDVYLAPDCITKLVGHLRDPGVIASVPRLVLHPEDRLIQLDGADSHIVGSMILRNARLEAARTPPEITSVGAVSTSCVLAKREALLAAGGLDENYFIYLEDQELGLRLRVLGHDIICDATAVAFHDRGEGTPGLSFRDQGAYPKRRAYFTMRNRWQTIFIHYSWRTFLLLAPVLLLYEAASLVLATKRGWLQPWWQAWVWLARNHRSLRLRRRFVSANRKRNEGSLLIGGPLPLAPGVIDNRLEAAAVAALSTIIEGYWRLVRPWVARQAQTRSL